MNTAKQKITVVSSDGDVSNNTYVVEIQGKHGIIEMVFPISAQTEEEKIQLHRKLAESAIRSHKKETTLNG